MSEYYYFFSDDEDGEKDHPSSRNAAKESDRIVRNAILFYILAALGTSFLGFGLFACLIILLLKIIL